MDDAGVTLINGVAAAGHCVAHWSPLQGAFTADHVIFTAASAHNVPLWARAVVVQIPVIWTKQYVMVSSSAKITVTSKQEILCNTISDVYRNREEDESILTSLVGKKNTADVGYGQQKPERQWKDFGEFGVYLSCCSASALWLFPLPYGCKLCKSRNSLSPLYITSDNMPQR